MTEPLIPAAPRSTRWPTRKLLLASYAAIALLALSPLLIAFAASSAAERLGCGLNEGDPRPCFFHGKDIGGALYTMFVMAWLSVGSLPLGIVAALIVTAVVLDRSSRRLWRRWWESRFSSGSATGSCAVSPGRRR